MWHQFVLCISSITSGTVILSYQKNQTFPTLACRCAEGQNCTKVMEKWRMLWHGVWSWKEKCFFFFFAWCSEWLVNIKVQNVSLRKLRFWSSCSEIFKDCISYLLYVCVHAARRGFVCTQKEAVCLTAVSPDVEHVPLRQQRPRGPVALWLLGVCHSLVHWALPLHRV